MKRDDKNKTTEIIIKKDKPSGEMARKALLRPNDYDKLSGEDQWEIDKQLGILDWDGDPRK